MKDFRINNVRWPIWALFFCVILQLVFYLVRFHGPLSSESSDWSAFSHYFGLSFSVLSVLLVYLTYRNQTQMSAVLQFESIFFQWHNQHRTMYNDLKKDIENFSNSVVLDFIETHKGSFTIEDFRSHSKDSDQRNVMRYYRSLYHLIKYVHLSPILDNDESKRMMYIDIIQAQMSDEELNTILYLLLTDEWKDSKLIFGCSWEEVIDKYHLFKNFYYPKTKSNFETFASFMNNEFKETKDAFHFLKLKSTPNS